VSSILGSEPASEITIALEFLIVVDIPFEIGGNENSLLLIFRGPV
jgi:hypothetical protein